MNLIDLIKNLLNLRKKINTSILPSQGLFYKDDFEIFIKRASEDDIIGYELNYIKGDVGLIIEKVKKLAKNNIIFSDGYTFDDIKSIDIIFLFLEIVKYTKGEPILLSYIDEDTDKDEIIEFGKDTFNYFIIDNNIIKYYDNNTKQFIINGYKYSLPSIGVENSLTNFLLSKSDTPGSNKYNEYFYDFTYFLGDKNKLSISEIENLIQIFNHDLEISELEKINEVMMVFMPMQSYSLVKNGKVIEISSKIDLEKIWK